MLLYVLYQMGKDEKKWDVQSIKCRTSSIDYEFHNYNNTNCSRFQNGKHEEKIKQY